MAVQSRAGQSVLLGIALTLPVGAAIGLATFARRKSADSRSTRGDEDSQPLDGPLPAEVDLATRARVDWAVHLHKEINQYIRTALQMMQILVAAGATIGAVLFRYDEMQTPAIIIAPYVLGTMMILWTEYTREIMIDAGIVEHLEERVEQTVGSAPLVQERILGRSKIGSLTAITNNTLTLSLFALSTYFSIVRSQDLPGRWENLHYAGLIGIVVGILLASIDTLTARDRARTSADRLDPPRAR